MKTEIDKQSIISALIKFINEEPGSLNLPDKINKLEIKPLGEGESNFNLLAIINDDQKLVFRIARLYKDRIQKEYEILSKIPDHIGPEPIYLDTSKKVIPHTFMVQSFVPGSSVENWDSDKLNSLAQTLAKLHNHTHTANNDTLSFVKKLTIDNNYFLKNNSDLTNDQEIMTLLQSVKEYLRPKEVLLDKVSRLSILHGDLNKENIRLDQDGAIRFIDWELAHYNDPAREFSTFYYDDMKYLDWRIKLGNPLRDLFLNEYMSNSGIEDSEFEERVSVWQLVDKTGAYIYCNWKVLNADNDKERNKFGDMARRLENSIVKITS